MRSCLAWIHRTKSDQWFGGVAPDVFLASEAGIGTSIIKQHKNVSSSPEKVCHTLQRETARKLEKSSFWCGICIVHCACIWRLIRSSSKAKDTASCPYMVVEGNGPSRRRSTSGQSRQRRPPTSPSHANTANCQHCQQHHSSAEGIPCGPNIVPDRRSSNVSSAVLAESHHGCRRYY